MTEPEDAAPRMSARSMATELPKKPKASRTSTPKARTGCITCKKRHVKCDENRPHCLNCLRSRGSCGGYSRAERKTGIQGPPQWQHCWALRRVTHATSPRLRMPLGTSSSDFGGSQGVLYFQEFVDLFRGPWVTAVSRADFWEVTLPQLAHANSTLRHAAMAIGALVMWRRESINKEPRPFSLSAPGLQVPDRGTHFFHAVAYYCQSLKLQKQVGSAKDAIFLSLLLLYFEMIQGDRKAALLHVNHGLALLLALLTDTDGPRHVAAFAPDPKPPLEAIADIYFQLATQARTVLGGRFGHGSSIPNLEAGLRRQKLTMESFMMILNELTHSSTEMDVIPAVFHSLDEFEKSWVAYRRRRTKMIQIMAEGIRALETRGATLGDESNPGSVHLELLGNPQIKNFCEDWRTTMHALDASFRPLFNRIIMSDSDRGSSSYLRAIHLRLQFLSCSVFEDPPQYAKIETLLSRTPLFHSYLSVARLALHAAKQHIKHPAQQLSLKCDLAWNLVLVALFCRDPLARDEAVSMLKEYPGQDGLWETRSLYVLALRCVTIDERNSVEGTLAEQWQRLLRREFVFENGGSRIMLRYLEKNTVKATWELVEDVADVHSEVEDVVWKRQPVTGSGQLLLELYGEGIHKT